MNCFPFSPLYDAEMEVSRYYHYVNILFNNDHESFKKNEEKK